MKIKKYLIAGGNPTLLVWDCPKAEKNNLIKANLMNVEQIGFITYPKSDLPKLTMMGNELCINAIIAFASELKGKGSLVASGAKKKIAYSNENGYTSVSLSLPYKRNLNLILFEGIGFIISNRKNDATKRRLRTLAQKYKLPAFGAIAVNQNRIKPMIFVKETDSCVEETACGSGSIATNIVYSFSEVIQPTGESISIKQQGDNFVISANVIEMKLENGGENI